MEVRKRIVWDGRDQSDDDAEDNVTAVEVATTDGYAAGQGVTNGMIVQGVLVDGDAVGEGVTVDVIVDKGAPSVRVEERVPTGPKPALPDVAMAKAMGRSASAATDRCHCNGLPTSRP